MWTPRGANAFSDPLGRPSWSRLRGGGCPGHPPCPLPCAESEARSCRTRRRCWARGVAPVPGVKDPFPQKGSILLAFRTRRCGIRGSEGLGWPIRATWRFEACLTMFTSHACLAPSARGRRTNIAAPSAAASSRKQQRVCHSPEDANVGTGLGACGPVRGWASGRGRGRAWRKEPQQNARLGPGGGGRVGQMRRPCGWQRRGSHLRAGEKEACCGPEPIALGRRLRATTASHAEAHVCAVSSVSVWAAERVGAAWGEEQSVSAHVNPVAARF